MGKLVKYGETSASCGESAALSHIARSGKGITITSSPSRENSVRDCGDDSLRKSNPDSGLRNITYQFWRMCGRQAEYRDRGTPNVIDLGDIGD